MSNNRIPFMTYREECEQLRTQVAALTEQNERLTLDMASWKESYCIANNLQNAANARADSLTAALGKAREALDKIFWSRPLGARESKYSLKVENTAKEALAAIDAAREHCKNDDLSTDATLQKSAFVNRNSLILALTGDRLTADKADHICERDGYKVTGVVLTLNDAECIVNMSAVRWLTKDEFWRVLHADAALGEKGEAK